MAKNKKAKQEARKKLQAQFIDYFEEAQDILQEEESAFLTAEQQDRFSKAINKMRELVEQGANPNSRYARNTNEIEDSLLVEAAQMPAPMLAHALLDMGANPRENGNRRLIHTITDHYIINAPKFLHKPKAHADWLALIKRLHTMGADFTTRIKKEGPVTSERPVSPLEFVRLAQEEFEADRVLPFIGRIFRRYLGQLEYLLQSCTLQGPASDSHAGSVDRDGHKRTFLERLPGAAATDRGMS